MSDTLEHNIINEKIYKILFETVENSNLVKYNKFV